MSIFSSPKMYLAAAVFGALAAAPAAQAQGYAGAVPYGANAPGYVPPQSEASTESLSVYGPPRAWWPQRTREGAPIGMVSISQPVRYDDLDLRTPWGARELRHRVRTTAFYLCRRLSDIYPDGFYPPAADNLPCRPTAIHDAMWEADFAIRSARHNRRYNP